MSEVTERVKSTLSKAAVQLRKTNLPNTLAIELERLATQVEEPCVVAVVGRVKAGKSTFINALLGEDLAKVGATATTATINFFRYGNPDANYPVRCYWRGGRVTHENGTFLDNLQGHDMETLRRAEGIEYLEYLVPNPWLRQVTFVDTPGTEAVVSEHQERTDEFLRLRDSLQNRNVQATERIGNAADAVIFLVGAVARIGDEQLLKAFEESTGTNAKVFNAVGVMAKIELSAEVLERRHELAKKISQQLRNHLNTVIPVATAVRRGLDHLLQNDSEGMSDLIEAMRRIPSGRLRMLLSSDEIYRGYEFDDCPISASQRRQLLGETPWSAFTAIARMASDVSLTRDQVVENLSQLTGFDTLKKVLEENFIKRGQLLRSYRIISDARTLLREEIRFSHLPQYKRRAREEEIRLNRFLRVIEKSTDDLDARKELESFVRQGLNTPEHATALERLSQELDDEFGALHRDLLEYNADFDALHLLEENSDQFSSAESDELRMLLGLYGIDINNRIAREEANVGYVSKRQLAWGRIREAAPHRSVRRRVADRAYARFGLILSQLLQ